MKNSQIRLQKFLADAGVASRRHCEELIQQGRVVVNGSVVTKMGVQVDPNRDFVKLDGKVIRLQLADRQYFMMNKPRSVLTALSDPRGRKTIAELLPRKLSLGKGRLYPIGRLDYDVSGCLFLTDDGELANRLMHPKYNVPRVYAVKVEGNPNPTALAKLRRRAKKCEVVKMPHKGEGSWFHITLYEGQYHQVKRLWMEAGHPVIKMSRVSFAGVEIGTLKHGQIRPLRRAEIEQLKKACDLI